MRCHLLLVLCALVVWVPLVRGKLEPIHKGCYKDEDDRDVPVFGVDLKENTFSQCQQLCKGYRYMAIQYSYQCRCGNTYGRYGSCDGGRCTSCGNACYARCVGTNMPCGGCFANSIYELPHFSPKFSQHFVHPARATERTLVLEASLADAVDETNAPDFERRKCNDADLSTLLRVKVLAPSKDKIPFEMKCLNDTYIGVYLPPVEMGEYSLSACVLMGIQCVDWFTDTIQVGPGLIDPSQTFGVWPVEAYVDDMVAVNITARDARGTQLPCTPEELPNFEGGALPEGQTALSGFGVAKATWSCDRESYTASIVSHVPGTFTTVVTYKGSAIFGSGQIKATFLPIVKPPTRLERMKKVAQTPLGMIILSGGCIGVIVLSLLICLPVGKKAKREDTEAKRPAAV